MVGVALHLRCLKQSPWSSAIEKRIDSLADWLIQTLGRPDDFTYFLFIVLLGKKKTELGLGLVFRVRVRVSLMGK